MRVVFVGKQRSIPKRLLLHVVTLGVSRRIWTHRVNKEADGHGALGIHHTREAWMLASPLAGLVAFLSLVGVLGALWAAALAALLFLPGSIVTAASARRTKRMLAGSGIAYGPWFPVYMSTWVPLLGSLFFIAWTQDRLNRFWAEERKHPEHGVDIDIDTARDPSFVVEMKEALKRSHTAGSRFDRRQVRWRQRRRAVVDRWESVRRERQAVRDAGGSTPVLPFLRPRRPAPRRLSVTCGRCEHAFDATRDPFAETVLHCPDCGLQEVLPSLADDPLAGTEKAAYAAVQATCPDCKREFHVSRRLDGPTPIRCPGCGLEDTLDAPKATA